MPRTEDHRPSPQIDEPGVDPAQTGYREAKYAFSARLPSVLQSLQTSLLISTYQAGQLLALGVDHDRLHLSARQFDQPMGIAVGDGRVALGVKRQVWELRERSDLAPLIEPQGLFDRCYLPQTSIVTGAIQGHELAWGRSDDGSSVLWIVNTLFSCLAVIDPEFSFIPSWTPRFITSLKPEDRCHLNGVAMRSGSPAFVTAMAVTNEPGGWRQGKNTGGAIIDVASGEVVTSGLSMPHSPRWYGERLFVLNSGMGRLEVVDLSTGSREVVALFPGYARGLALHGGFAFVGLSRIRETAVFGGAPIAKYHEELKCGMAVVDVSSGNTVATLEFTSGVEELFDIQVVAGARVVTLGSDADRGDDIWVVPDKGPSLRR